jgi:hypothetical protein
MLLSEIFINPTNEMYHNIGKGMHIEKQPAGEDKPDLYNNLNNRIDNNISQH